MFKIHLLSLLSFISASVLAQSNLMIDSFHIPVRVLGNTITLQTGTDTFLEIPSRSGDTIVTFNPETYGEHLKIIITGPGTRTIPVKDINLQLKRSQFLEYPLVYLSHNGLDYAPYRFVVYYWQPDKYIGLGFDDTVVIGPFYSLRYYKNTSLIDFEAKLKEKLPKDVTEIYISGAAFYSPDTGEEIFLADRFKIALIE